MWSCSDPQILKRVFVFLYNNIDLFYGQFRCDVTPSVRIQRSSSWTTSSPTFTASSVTGTVTSAPCSTSSSCTAAVGAVDPFSLSSPPVRVADVHDGIGDFLGRLEDDKLKQLSGVQLTLMEQDGRCGRTG